MKKAACLLVLLSLVALSLWLRRPSQPAIEVTPEVVVKVRWQPAAAQVMAQQAVAQGTVTPLRQAVVSAVQGGVIDQMQLWKNQRVQAGQLLARLDLRDLAAQRNEAQAFVQEAQISLNNLQNGANVLAQATADKDVRQAASTLKNARALQQRRQRLYQDGGLALKDLQDSQLAASVAQANYDLSIRSRQLLNAATRPGSVALAQSKLEEARRRVATLSSPLRFGEIRAPISGTVTDQFQYLGEYVTPGAKLLSLADLSEVIVKGQFPDTVLAQLQVGQIAWVRPLDRPELKLKGKITALSAVTDPQSRSGEVWVQLANGDGKLRGGGFCEVAVDTGQHRSLLVPDSALTLDQPEAPQGWLAVVDGQHVAHLRRVTCGLKRNGYTEIVQGLFANELVVTQGNVGLADGTRVSL